MGVCAFGAPVDTERVPRGGRPTTDEGPDLAAGALIIRTEQLPRQDSNLN